MKRILALGMLMMVLAGSARAQAFGDGRELTDWRMERSSILGLISEKGTSSLIFTNQCLVDVTMLPKYDDVDVSADIDGGGTLDAIWTTNVGAGATFEPSGLYYDDVNDWMYIAGDDGGIARMRSDGSLKDVRQTRVAQSGTWWTNSANKNDFEAITQTTRGDTNIYVGAERFLNVQHGCIIKCNMDSLDATNMFTVWDIHAQLDSPASNLGLEALAFIASNDCPSWVTNSNSSGLFIASVQASGKMYLLDVPLTNAATTRAYSNVTVKASWNPVLTKSGKNRNDMSDMFWDGRNKILYMLYDEGSEGANDPDAISGQGRTVYAYNLETRHPMSEWRLPVGTGLDNPEGMTLSSNNTAIAISYDALIYSSSIDALTGRK